MTPAHVGHHVARRPACSPAAIREVLAANADAETLHSYDRELDAAYEQAQQDGDLGLLVRTVRRWWFEADAWLDPNKQREFQRRVNRLAAERATAAVPGRGCFMKK